MNKLLLLLSVYVFFYTEHYAQSQSSKPYIPQQQNLRQHYPKIPLNHSKSSGCWIPLDASYIDISNAFTTSYDPMDDGSYGPLNLGFTFTFYGQTYNSIYINVNGNITLTFDNTIRTNSNNNSFYRTGNTITSYPETIKLHISGQGYEDETAIRFSATATDSFDVNVDAYKLLSGDPNAPVLYTFIQQDKISINTLPEFNNGVVTVPLYFEPGISGTYTITLSYKGEFDANTTITLEDIVTGTFHDVIYDGDYTFTMNTNDPPHRFFVHFNKTITGIHQQNLQVKIFSYENTISISGLQTPGRLTVYDMSGKIILQQQLKINDSRMIVLPENNASGIYFVKITTETQTIVKKLWIENTATK